MFNRIDSIIDADTDNPIELAKIIGCNERGFFRGANFDGVDVSGLDLTVFDLTGADFKGVIADAKTMAAPEFIRSIRSHGLITLVDRAVGSFDPVRFDDFYHDLKNMRELSELANIGVTGEFEQYFQDGVPELRGISTTVSVEDPRTRAHEADLAVHPSNLPRHKFGVSPSAQIDLVVQANRNTPPADYCELTTVSSNRDLSEHLHLKLPATMILDRIDKLMNVDISISVTFQTRAVPRRTANFVFNVNVVEDTVNVELDRSGRETDQSVFLILVKSR